MVEDNLGQMVEDVKAAVEGKSEVYLADVFCRHLPTYFGMIMPAKVLEKIRELL